MVDHVLDVHFAEIVYRCHGQAVGWAHSGAEAAVAADTNVLGYEKSTVHVIGIKLMTDFVVPFEVASLLLLIALMGAAYTATDKQKV